MTFEEFVDSPARPLNQTGTVFLDMLTAADQHHLNLALAVGNDDPFGLPSIPLSAVEFVKRNWIVR